jgi:hypothetical protein
MSKKIYRNGKLVLPKLIAGGCSFTFGHELSDDNEGRTPSKKSWAHGLKNAEQEYLCTAKGGAGNSGIARRIFTAIAGLNRDEIGAVVVMWSFPSRYDWAMPRHKLLEKTRWASITPWDTTDRGNEAFEQLQSSEPHTERWQTHLEEARETGVKPFADALYQYAANQYHELYLSWKSIIWLQNILEKKHIPYMFTLADNSLFYDEMKIHAGTDVLMNALYKEIDFTKWVSFGERMMGFNQWAHLNEYERGVTHPLDKAHTDAVQLMLPQFKKIVGGK